MQLANSQLHFKFFSFYIIVFKWQIDIIVHGKYYLPFISNYLDIILLNIIKKIKNKIINKVF